MSSSRLTTTIHGVARDESLALDTIEKIEGGWPSTDLRAVYKEFGRGRFFNIIETFQHNHNS